MPVSARLAKVGAGETAPDVRHNGQGKRRRSRPLDRKVRPEGQKEAPCLEEGRGPRKTAGPRKRRSAARMIAGGACYTSAGGQKG